jgi:hypothetical protein
MKWPLHLAFGSSSLGDFRWERILTGHGGTHINLSKYGRPPK